MEKKELEKIEADERVAEELGEEIREREERDRSPDYPLGGMLEPYDIEKEKELTEKNSAFSL